MNVELQDAYRAIRGIVLHHVGHVYNIEVGDSSVTFTLTYVPDILSILIQNAGTRTELVISHTSKIHEYHDVIRCFLDETSYADRVETAIKRYKAYYQHQTLKYFNIKRNLARYADLLHLGDANMKDFGYKNAVDFILTMSHLYDKKILTHVSFNEIKHDGENNGFGVTICSEDKIYKALGYDRDSELNKVLKVLGINYFSHSPVKVVPSNKKRPYSKPVYQLQLGFFK